MDNVIVGMGNDPVTPEVLARMVTELDTDACPFNDIEMAAGLPMLFLTPDYDLAVVELAHTTLDEAERTPNICQADFACLLERSAGRLHCYFMLFAEEEREEPGIKVHFVVEADTPTVETWLVAVAEAGILSVTLGARSVVVDVSTEALSAALDDWRTR